MAMALVATLAVLLVIRLIHQTPPPRVGGPAPNFELPVLGEKGRTLSLRQLRGKPVVLNFWVSDCVPCAGEASALERLYSHYHRDGLIMVGVDYQDPRTDAERFITKHHVTYLNVSDGSGGLADPYRLLGTPETFFINREGRLVGNAILGPITLASNRPAVQRLVHTVLAE